MGDNSAEFDSFADEYESSHRQNTAFTGEAPEYFARYKIEELYRAWNKRRDRAPCDILDFGCGVGTSLPHLRRHFSSSKIVGIDISTRSLERAQLLQVPGVALHQYNGNAIPIPERSLDLIFTSCVFHHIEPAARLGIAKQLRGLLRPGGLLVIFEHNPYNPVTQYIVATCIFDKNAVLLSAKELADIQRNAGFRTVEARFTGFFPAHLAALRRFEGALSRIPLGAQYYTIAEG